MNKTANKIVIGQSGTGKSFARKVILSNELITEHIVKNHLNNNNWLKLHGKPMVRKGHPWYSRVKELKDAKYYKFILLEMISEMVGFEISDEKDLREAIKFIWGKTNDLAQKEV